jgi:hypothetical protein
MMITNINSTSYMIFTWSIRIIAIQL